MALGATYNQGAGQRLPPLFVVPVTETAGALVVHNASQTWEQKKDFGSERTIAQIDLQLRDYFGRALDPILEWAIVLEFTT